MTSILLVLFLAASPYCDGFTKGWQEGWCYGQFTCVTMPVPPCPVHVAGKDRWQDGYNDGFVKSKNEADELRGKKKTGKGTR